MDKLTDDQLRTIRAQARKDYRADPDSLRNPYSRTPERDEYERTWIQALKSSPGPVRPPPPAVAPPAPRPPVSTYNAYADLKGRVPPKN